MTKLEPVDGTAIILHLIEAARAWTYSSGHGDTETVALIEWVGKLEERYARERIEAAPVGWEPRYWRDLVSGDRVNVDGHEAVIESAIPLAWHVDPDEKKRVWHEGPDRDQCKGCSGLRCKKARGWLYPALEWGKTVIKLEGRETLYRIPFENEVETLRGPAGRAVDEANGYRSVLGEEPVNVMASWAADAALTLEAAGLGPIEVIR